MAAGLALSARARAGRARAALACAALACGASLPGGVAAAGPAAAPDAGADTDGLPLVATRQLAFDVHEGTWLSLTVSPDGHRIVFDLLGDLYALDAAGGSATALTRGLAFDSQPAYSRDGAWLAYVSDRSGAENVWIARADGTGARRITANEGVHEYVSPAWSADGRSVYVSLYRSDRNAAELWCYAVDGATPPRELTGHAYSALGAVASPDGRYLYFASSRDAMFEDDVTLPRWRIDRLTLANGQLDTVVVDPGSAMRPVLSPDGRWLAYAVRTAGATGLRLRELDGGADRLVAWPVQHDAQEALPSRDLVPGYAFTPDGRTLLAAYEGTIHRIPLDGTAATVVPMDVHVELALGPSQRRELREPEGPVHARLVQYPAPSPDGRWLAFGAMGRVYLQSTAGGSARRVTRGDGPAEAQPAWSPDGRMLAWVSWDAAAGGALWSVDVQPKVSPPEATPRPLAPPGPFYTDPAFAPDGRTVYALRSSAEERRHTYKEPALWLGRDYGSLRQADLVAVPAAGGSPATIASGVFEGPVHFAAGDAAHAYLNTAAGLERYALADGTHRVVAKVQGAGYYFIEGPVAADELRLGPDGHHLLALMGNQLHLLDLAGEATTRMGSPTGSGPTAGKEPPAPIDLHAPRVPHRQLAPAGADYFGFSADGRSAWWSVGSTWHVQPLAGDAPAVALPIDVQVPRDAPVGALVLRGATVFARPGEQVLEDADVVISGHRIAAVGRRGEVAVPPGAAVRDVHGLFIVPGYVDTHDHFGDIRRGVLDFANWGFPATLAYGVTSALDPSTLGVDMLAYQDLLDAGLCLGPRLYSTGPAVFSFNEFTSPQQVRDVLGRYARDYRLGNLKEYRSGNRRVRQWIAEAAQDLGLVATTEGALDLKLDLTQVMDGYAGNEHTLAALPLSRDIIELMARARTSYTPTLTISHGGPPAGEELIAREDPLGDAKVGHYFPRYAREHLFSRVHWTSAQEHAYPVVAAGAVAIQRAGGLVGVGSHGNYPGIGYHFELEALASGGMSPMEVLRAATLGSAETIGRAADLGSLEAGKLADLVILEADPRGGVRALRTIREVMKGGRLYEAATLAEEWPEKKPPPARWFDGEAPR